MIAIVDYGIGNLASVYNALLKVGAQAERTSDPERILAADGIILPGVGAASAGMQRLKAAGLDRTVIDAAGAGIPLLGLCLGMQLLFEWSEEGSTTCLGLLPGTVRRLQGNLKVPHIGWNRVRQRGTSALWHDSSPDPYYYFVHSYVCVPDGDGLIAGTTDYGQEFCSAVASGSVWGVQFHPERSGTDGLQLVKNFALTSSAGYQAKAG